MPCVPNEQLLALVAGRFEIRGHGIGIWVQLGADDNRGTSCRDAMIFLDFRRSERLGNKVNPAPWETT